jgi:hypothetical protein
MPVSSEVLDGIVAALQVRIPHQPEAQRIQSIATFSELKDLIDQQVAFWQPHSAGLDKISTHFVQTQQFLRSAAAQGDASTARGQMQQAVSKATARAYENIYSDTALAKFLVKLQENDAEAARGAFAYFSGTLGETPFAHIAGRVRGVVAAVAFSSPDFLAGALDSRIAAFDEQRNELSALRGQIAENDRAVRKDTEEWKSASRASVQKMLEDSQGSLSAHEQEWTNTFSEAHAKRTQEFDALQKAFAEHLRITAPAEYWEVLAREYQAKGRWWMLCSTAAVVAFAISVSLVAYRPPEIFSDPKHVLGGIKGALLIAAGVSMIIYLINLLVKMCTSAYHLARDARERLQLTHVFLALIKESAIEPKDREIVLSALFSRADTGLLKGDSGPTVPTPMGTFFEALKGGR